MSLKRDRRQLTKQGRNKCTLTAVCAHCGMLPTLDILWDDGLCSVCHYKAGKHYQRAKTAIQDKYYRAGIRKRSVIAYEGGSVFMRILFMKLFLAILNSESLNKTPKAPNYKLPFSPYWLERLERLEHGRQL